MNQPWCRSSAGAAGLAALLLACPASAASQGALGATSRGSVTISVSIPAPARIAGLADFALDGAGTMAAGLSALDVCFRGAAHAYTVSASGSGPGGALSLANGDERIAYRIEWRSRAGEGASDALSGDTPVTIHAVADAADCAHAPGAGQLRIALEPAGADRLQSGAPYTGTLSLTLAPE